MKNCLFRFVYIVSTFYRFGLLDILSVYWPKSRSLKFLGYLPGQTHQKLLQHRLRLALESLGPIFVKFGQLLSIRPDLLPAEYIKELANLQENVAPFSTELVYEQIQKHLKHPAEVLYVDFNPIPVASASVAQVHHAWLRKANGKRGHEVAIKILRPNIQSVIEQDLAVLYRLASLLGKLLPDVRRLHLHEIVLEFDKSLHGELDLMREAANASQLKRNFSDENTLLVPEIYFDYCAREVMTMQWMIGIPISKLNKLHKKDIDLPKLAKLGINIFFTQVFRHGFFHADMHPGNVLITNDGRYIALDCGIVGTLNAHDKHYVAVNFLAFFNRDYHRVATAHVECGWIPADSNISEFESAIRTVCEPIFEQPLSKISFGLLLMRLFEVGRTFKINIQPQLILLQKMFMHIESLGRELDPMLDLWSVAKPFLSQWVNEQIGWRSFLKEIKQEIPKWTYILPAIPRKLHEWLLFRSDTLLQSDQLFKAILQKTKQQNQLLMMTIALLVAAIGLFCFLYKSQLL